MKQWTAVTIGALAAFPAVTWACSGPGAMAAIERAERLGWQLFGGTCLLAVLATLVLRRWQVGGVRLASVALPVVVHPGWWLTARGGDCGSMRLLGSIGVSAVAAVALSLAVIVTAVRRARELEE